MSSSELAVYTKHKPMLAELLVSSLSRLASSVGSRSEVDNEHYHITDKFRQTSTQEERAKSLIDAVIAKMDKRMDAVAAVMKELIECIEETSQLHAYNVE